jgi:hypothetical protein
MQLATMSGWATWLTVAWCAAGTMLYLLAPKIAPVALVLCLVAPLLWLGPAIRHLRPFQVSGLTTVSRPDLDWTSLASLDLTQVVSGALAPVVVRVAVSAGTRPAWLPPPCWASLPATLPPAPLGGNRLRLRRSSQVDDGISGVAT